MLQFLIKLDTQLFLIINSFHSQAFDEIMWILSGKYIWIPVYLFFLIYVIWKHKLNGLLIFLLLISGVTIADRMSDVFIKETIHRLRPSHDPALMNIIHTLNGYSGGMYSFVSAHAVNSFTLATFTSIFMKNRWYTIIIFVWAVSVCYSRIYLGVHFPGDVICGAAFGSAMGSIMFIAYLLLFQKKINNLRSNFFSINKF